MSGRPTSSNGASSFHLFWAVPADEELIEAGVTLTIPELPSVPRLYFWALQVSFDTGAGAHLGLQWGADPPRRTFHANWGGYRGDGGELDGTESLLPSSFDNPNTRDFDWEPGRPHRLRISREPEGWAGRIDGTVIRLLSAPGGRILGPMVWSEVFADCDDASVTARWSGLEVVTKSGRRVDVDTVTTNYQDRRSGGCDNTSSSVQGDAFVQTTTTTRSGPQGAVLRLA